MAAKEALKIARILIVDDEPDIHQLIRRYAEREGHETTEASNGMEDVYKRQLYAHVHHHYHG